MHTYERFLKEIVGHRWGARKPRQEGAKLGLQAGIEHRKGGDLALGVAVHRLVERILGRHEPYRRRT